MLSFGAGVCSPEDTEKCLVFLYLLEDAVFPLPIVHPNGTIEWPDGNMPNTLILYHSVCVFRGNCIKKIHLGRYIVGNTVRN